MVRTANQIPLTDRFKNFIFWLWGLVYLFIATIFSDPGKLQAGNGGTDRWGARGNGIHKINGMKRGGSGPRMGGG